MTMTTTSIEQHKTALDEFENNPLTDAFETYVKFALKEKDIEILGLHKKIDVCLSEIKTLKTLFKLADRT